ncbi:MAG: hypothetical protein JWR12_2519 [Mucilaginibacter sp.]|nr:hypothetical protein [Mucilaginibacter sp.]
MKYAFIIGSNAFIVPKGIIYCGNRENERIFLQVNSIYHDTTEGSLLDIDVNIKDTDGTPVVIIANQAVTGAPYSIKKQRDSIKIVRSDGSMIIHVHQLDDEAAMALEHNIVVELEVHAPIAVIRISGEFMVDSLHISAENEKLYINSNGYATSAMVGKNRLTFTSAGVVL